MPPKRLDPPGKRFNVELSPEAVAILEKARQILKSLTAGVARPSERVAIEWLIRRAGQGLPDPEAVLIGTAREAFPPMPQRRYTRGGDTS